MIDLFLKWFVPFAFGLISSLLITFVKKNAKKEKAIENGVQALLRNELIREYRDYKTKGSMSILDKENMEDMFEAYENLEGNGTVKELYDEMMNIETKIIK